jgi:phosphatidylinositol glycan class N
MIIFLSFSPAFIILAISWEGLFYEVFCMTLMTWVRLEHAVYINTAGSKMAVYRNKTRRCLDPERNLEGSNFSARLVIL